ncbi:unnamed protein product, partial [Ectocarpus sp. 12 AP-2014]
TTASRTVQTASWVCSCGRRRSGARRHRPHSRSATAEASLPASVTPPFEPRRSLARCFSPMQATTIACWSPSSTPSRRIPSATGLESLKCSFPAEPRSPSTL